MAQTKRDFVVKSAAVIDDMVKLGMKKEARAVLAIAAAVETGVTDALQLGEDNSSSGSKLSTALVKRVKSKSNR